MAASSVSVWWDVESCPIPGDLSPVEVIENVNRFLELKEIHGAWNMHIVGGSFRVNSATALIPSVNLRHFLPGEARIHESILFWALDACPPAIILVAAVLDSDLSRVLIRLKNRNFRVIHASPSAASPSKQGPDSFNCSSPGLHQELKFRSRIQIPADLPEFETVDWEYVSAGFSSPDKLSLAKSPLTDVTPRKLLHYVMHSLEHDKLLPSDFNVQARLRYVMAKQGLKDVPGWSSWKFVERALAAGELVVMSEECNDVYLPKGRETCWPWIDPSFPCNVYEDGVWLALQRFLLAEGRWAMESSKSRYHAAETLKIEGPEELRELVMGQLIHVVQLSVTLRGWIKPHPTKWTPLQVTICEPSPLLHQSGLLLLAQLSSSKPPGFTASNAESCSVKPTAFAAASSASRIRLSLPAIASIVSRPSLPSLHLLPRELAEVKAEGPPTSTPMQDTRHWTEEESQAAGVYGEGREQKEQSHGSSCTDQQEVPVKPWDDVLKGPAGAWQQGAAGEEGGPSSSNEERSRAGWRRTLQLAESDPADPATAFSSMPASPSPSPMSWRRRQKLQEFREFASRVLLGQPHGLHVDHLQRECARRMPRGFNPEALGFACMRDALESMKDLARMEVFPGGFTLVFAAEELKDANSGGYSSPLTLASPAAAPGTAAAAGAASVSDLASPASPSPYGSGPSFRVRELERDKPSCLSPAATAASGSVSTFQSSISASPPSSPPPVPKPRPEGYRRFDTSWGGQPSPGFSPRSSPRPSPSLRFKESPFADRKPFKDLSSAAPSFPSPLSHFTSLPSPSSLRGSPALPGPAKSQLGPAGWGEDSHVWSDGRSSAWDQESPLRGSAGGGGRQRTEGRWREVREVKEVREVGEVKKLEKTLKEEAREEATAGRSVQEAASQAEGPQVGDVVVSPAPGAPAGLAATGATYGAVLLGEESLTQPVASSSSSTSPRARATPSVSALPPISTPPPVSTSLHVSALPSISAAPTIIPPPSNPATPPIAPTLPISTLPPISAASTITTPPFKPATPPIASTLPVLATPVHSKASPLPHLELPSASIPTVKPAEGKPKPSAKESISGKAAVPVSTRAAESAKGRASEGGKSRAAHKAELMRSDLRQLLQEVLSKPGVQKTGYQLAFLKGAFLQKYAYPLDHTVLGYPKLKALLLSMGDVVNVVAAPGGHGVLFPAKGSTPGKSVPSAPSGPAPSAYSVASPSSYPVPSPASSSSPAKARSARVSEERGGGYTGEAAAVKEVVKAATHWQVKTQHTGKAKEHAATSAAADTPPSPASTSSPGGELTRLPLPAPSVPVSDYFNSFSDQPLEAPLFDTGVAAVDVESPRVAALVLASLQEKLEDTPASDVPDNDAEDDVDAREEGRWCSTM